MTNQSLIWGVASISIFATVVLFLFVIVAILTLVVLGKDRILKRKRKAEQELGMALLDKRLIFEEDGSSNRTIDSSTTCIISSEDISIIKKIGEGGQGIVYLARWKGIDVAVKTIKISDERRDYSRGV